MTCRREPRRFLALGASSIAMITSPEVCSLWADLKQHLTELSLAFESQKYSEDREAPDLGILNMLTALQKLQLTYAAYTIQYADLKEQNLELMLPNLASFKLRCLQNGELDLNCPRLADLTIERARCLRIRVGEANLAELVLDECIKVRFVVHSSIRQLRNLKTLMILKGPYECSKQDRQFIKDLGEMGRLQRLEYENLPTACIPRSLPLGLEHLRLTVVDQCTGPLVWYPDLRIECVWKDHGDRSWDSTHAKPLAELLLMHDMSPLQMSVLHRVVTCMTGRGLTEARGSLCCGYYFDTILIHDPLDGKHMGRVLEARLQDQMKRECEVRDAEYPIARRRWSPGLQVEPSTYRCEIIDKAM